MAFFGGFGCAPCCAADESEAMAKNPEWKAAANMLEEHEEGPPAAAAAWLHPASTAADTKADSPPKEEAQHPESPPPVDPQELGSAGAEEQGLEPTEGFCFMVTLERLWQQAPFGIKFDKNDQRCLEIISVAGGEEADSPVALYNQSVEPRLRLTAGRFVMSVNGVSSNTTLMEKEWSTSLTVELRVCEPRRFEVELHKAAGAKLGVDVDCCKLGSSIILVAIADGMIMDWNKQHAGEPYRVVQALDRIIGVNGEAMSSQQLLLALKEATGSVRLVIARPVWQDVLSSRNGNERGAI